MSILQKEKVKIVKYEKEYPNKTTHSYRVEVPFEDKTLKVVYDKHNKIRTLFFEDTEI